MVRAHVSLLLGLLVLMLPLSAHASGLVPPLVQDDAGSGQDAGNHQKHALTIGPGAYFGNVTRHLDDVDYYSVFIPAGDGIAVTLWSLSEIGLLAGGAVSAIVYGPNNARYGLEVAQAVYASADFGGPWFLQVAPDSMPSGHYYFGVQSVLLAPQDDGGSGMDAGMTPERAVALTEGTFQARIGGFDEGDVYRIPVAAGERVRLELPDPGVGFFQATAEVDGDDHMLANNGTARVFEWTAQDPVDLYVKLRYIEALEYVTDYVVRVSRLAPGSLPNLAVGSISWRDAPPDPLSDCGWPYVGTFAFQFSMIIENRGGVASPPVHASFYKYLDDVTPVIGCAQHADVPSLAPGESFLLEFSYSYGPLELQGHHEVIVDTGLSVQEQTEADNARAFSVDVGVGELVF